jgi:hypothetical protein
MIEKIDFSKIENSHIEPLDFEVIEKAAKGDSESIRLVIEHYNPYITELATKILFDEFGQQYRYTDETLRCQLENKLIKSVLKFKIQV